MSLSLSINIFRFLHHVETGPDISAPVALLILMIIIFNFYHVHALGSCEMSLVARDFELLPAGKKF